MKLSAKDPSPVERQISNDRISLVHNRQTMDQLNNVADMA